MVAKRFASVVLLLVVGVFASPDVTAAPMGTPGPSAGTQVRDVALHGTGILTGQLLDAQGVAIDDASVSVAKAGKEVARVKTDKQGKFRVAGLTGGVHQVATAESVGVYRLWAPQTAPPAAQRGLLLVSNAQVVRGQCGCGTPVCGSSVCGCGAGGVYGRGAGGGGIAGWMANHPLITTGGIAAAIAIPLAVDDDDPPASP